MSSPTLLVDFPAVVKSKVLEKLDIHSILKLRKVCHNLRQFIDENPPKFDSFTVEVRTIEESISIIMDSSKYVMNIWNKQTESIDFRSDRNGCIIQWMDSNKVRKEMVEKGNFIDVFLREFGIIMKNHSTRVLNSFSINLCQGEHGEQVLEELTKIRCVSTDEVVFDGCTVDQIAKFLPFFNSNDLNKIRIKEHFEPKVEDQENPIRMLNLQEIRQLEQWKNSKHVNVEAVDFYIRIQDFLHFEQVRVNCKMISIQDIVLLKESFLTSPALTSFYIQVYDYFNEIEELHASLGFPSLPVDQGNPEEIWLFRIPNNEDVLRVICNMEDLFYFRRIKIQNVPEGAVIRD
ncbi:hypothetical protein CRE_23476 [Caenorhabditis remanei]|uniref:F-box domain-containing protein n=1 Tax=Caenorhabditis remanei TaxID=31234 RepID=E3MGX3_CAERE|nr:hypothetical protein CRE_23476 [Caenorhabditis remanei]